MEECIVDDCIIVVVVITDKKNKIQGGLEQKNKLTRSKEGGRGTVFSRPSTAEIKGKQQRWKNANGGSLVQR